jgi:dihydroflavonol-4-reductase
MNKTVLVTGADGLLGSHVVRRTLESGYQVRAFIQANRNTGSLDGLDVEYFRGDLTNHPDIQQSIEGCDYLIHTAGSTSVWPDRSPASWKINYDVVIDLANAARENELERFIHIGSASSFGYGTKQNPGDEDSPFKGHKFQLDYLDSKKAAQDYLLDQYTKTGLPVIILAPTFMIGEYDSTPGSGKMIIAVVQHQVPGYTKGGRSVVYAGDVAQAAVNALTMGRLGECYITGGENLTYKEFFGKITDQANVPPIKICLPTRLTCLFGSLLEILSKFTGKPPMLSRTMAAISGDTNFYQSRKAIDELNMPQTPINEAIEKSIEYFRQINYL